MVSTSFSRRLVRTSHVAAKLCWRRPDGVRYQDFWWLFCTDGHSAPDAELHAWYADDIFSTWRPHAGNPIKRDIASARPGGTPFEFNGCLFRPAQDCSERYNGRLVINEIIELSPKHFRERRVSVLEPDGTGLFPDGLHTASGAGEFTVIDGNRFRFESRQAARVCADTPTKFRSCYLISAESTLTA